MSLLGRERRQTAVEERSGVAPWAFGLGRPTVGVRYLGATGIERALRNAASWACIDILADAIGRTPFDVFRATGGERTPVLPTPHIIDDPSAIVEPDVWRYQLGWGLVTDGNTFGIATDFTGPAGQFPTAVELIPGESVTNRRMVQGWPTVTIDGRDEPLWPLGRVVHFPGRMVPTGSPFALSPVEYANATIGTSLSVHDYTSGFFESGGTPTGILYADEELEPAQSEELKEAVRRVLTQARETLVLGAGLKYEAAQTAPGETQFIELLRFEVEQACRVWRVPPSMVYLARSGQSVTYQNVTDADLAYLKHSLDGYLVRVETRLSRFLPRPQIVRANRDAILRADVKTRMAVHEMALRNRIRSVNDVRRIEDEPPFSDPDFDLPGVPPWTTTPDPAGGQP